MRWYEDDNSDRERFAPLLLVPVQLDRPNAHSRFKLRYSGDEITTNLSLQARLKADFGIELPDVPDSEEMLPSDYLAQVREVVRMKSRWEVLADDMVLWFFSFAKFLMYRDLDPTSWPTDRQLQDHGLTRSLLAEGFRGEPPLCGDEENIDRHIAPIDMVHVLDADSSQTLVIEEVKQGRNLVIQGPPGTGKSQTIANLIAAAVKAGKTVLFVAEKMAALEVVQRRLMQVGLGEMSLELHSHKAHKQTVLSDLERVLQLGKPKLGDVEDHCRQLTACRDQLNDYLQKIHSPGEPSGLSLYRIVGELVRLRAEGAPSIDATLEGALDWTPADWAERRNLLADTIQRLEEVGDPMRNPWRGVELDVVLPTDLDRFLKRIPSLVADLEALRQAHDELAERLKLSLSADFRSTSRLAQIARRLLIAPAADRRGLGEKVWRDQRPRIEQLVAEGKRLAQYREELSGQVVESGWDVDPSEARRNLAAHGRSWFRLFHRDYRQAMAFVRGIVVDRPPSEFSQRLQLLDQLIAARKCRQAVTNQEAEELGRQAFGSHWLGEKSDWKGLAAILQWEAECREAALGVDIPGVLSELETLSGLESLVKAIQNRLKSAANAVTEICGLLRLDSALAFRRTDLLQVPYDELAERMSQWEASSRQLAPWVAYFVRHRRLEEIGLSPIAQRMQQGELVPQEALGCCELLYHETLIREVFRRHPELARFHGGSHEQLQAEFRKLDFARIELARQEVAAAHYQRLPAASAQAGEIGVIRREIQKKRRHLPLRKLLSEAGRAMQAIKPVFMMSPISVAQYLEPGGLEFDLLLVDEASQVQPVDALGAIARCKQLVVVGDSRQLPPTRFFSRLLDDEAFEDSDEGALKAGDMESILGLCCAQNVPQRMLSWHYRSRHHSLIAVSNREFYDNRLYVIPSPAQPGPGQGLMFVHVPDGLFDRGGSASNQREAQVVAQAVMEHARKFPSQSLGVGTFSVAQRDAILNELELLRRADLSCESFFAGGVSEPFFVKNLENIQGDERDVILISVGYGRNADGYMAMNFGPVSNDGGERRLNVLITRARESCRVYSSITANDIDLQRAKARGAAALKSFLTYAETGLLDTGSPTGRNHDSEFERQVALALAQHGFDVEPQVGVAGFFIDLAIRDPDLPGRYLLGIECDGANYHRSRSARDRDRLRQAVLENRGWKIHRIWSTDWFQRPEDELRKVLGAIEQARMSWANRETAGIVSDSPERITEAPPPENPTIAREVHRDPEATSEGTYPTRPYEVASFRISRGRSLQQLRPPELAKIVTRVVQIEGPIHREEIIRRVTQLGGLQRTGRRVREAVEAALAKAAQERLREEDTNFFMVNEIQEVPIRDRGVVPSSSLRKPEMLPPAEIRQAMLAVVRVHFGVAHDEAIIETARLFGYRSTSPQLREVLERELGLLLSQGELEERNGRVYLA